MASGDVIEYVQGGTRVRVQGLNSTLRKLRQAGVDADNQRELMHSIGMIVVQDANPPVLSGALKATIRAGRGKTKAVVRAGTAKVPYAGVIHYGNPYNATPSHPFLTDSLHANHAQIFAALDRGVEDLLAKAGL